MKIPGRVEEQVDQSGVYMLPSHQVDRWRDDANIAPRNHLRQIEEPLWNEQLADIGLHAAVHIPVLHRHWMHAVLIEQAPNRIRSRFTGQENRVDLSGQQGIYRLGGRELFIGFADHLVGEPKYPEQRARGCPRVASGATGEDALARQVSHLMNAGVSNEYPRGFEIQAA
jgi:hypothetical protein